jgi:hypothetical protein
MKSGQENKETSNHPWTASPKCRHRSLACSKKMVEAANADRRSLHGKGYDIDGICEQQERSTSTNYYYAPRQHKFNIVTDRSQVLRYIFGIIYYRLEELKKNGLEK